MKNPDQKPEMFGVVPVVPIPFCDDEEIDEDGLRRQLQGQGDLLANVWQRVLQALRGDTLTP